MTRFAWLRAPWRTRAGPRAVSPPGGRVDPPLAGLDVHRLERLSFARRGPAAGGPGGEHRARSRSPSVDFVDYRPYGPGDDFRRVDWHVYGRLGSLQVRVTEGLERQTVLLVLDCSASMGWGEPDKLAHAVRLVAGLAYVALARADRVAVACLGGAREGATFGPVTGRPAFHDLVRFLADLRPEGTAPDLGDALPRALRALPGRQGRAVLVVLVSDLLAADADAQLAAGLRALGERRAEVAVLQVAAPRERHPEPLGPLWLQDLETGERLTLTASLDVVERYGRRYEDWLARVRAATLGRGALHVYAPTDRPAEVLLLDGLRQAGVLR